MVGQMDRRGAFRLYVERGKAPPFADLIDTVEHQTWYPPTGESRRRFFAVAARENGASRYKDPKSRNRTIVRLERLLATRSGELRDLTLQAVHFVQILAQQGGHWRDAYLAVALTGPGTLEHWQRSLSGEGPLHAPDGYELARERLPLLDAFTGFLIELDAALREGQEGRVPPPDAGPVGAVLLAAATAAPGLATSIAARLAAVVERWLDEVARTHEEILRANLAFDALLEDRDEIRFDDAGLLAFWRRSALQRELMLFPNVLRVFAQIAQAVEEEARDARDRRALDDAKAPEEGSELHDQLAAFAVPEADDDPLQPFEPGEKGAGGRRARPPGVCAATKLLLGSEVDRLRPIVDAGAKASDLPLGLLRAAVIGPIQGRIAQALRDGAPELARQLASLGPEILPDDAYSRQVLVWQDLAMHLLRMRRFVLALALRHRDVLDEAKEIAGEGLLEAVMATLDRTDHGLAWSILADAERYLAGIHRAPLKAAIDQPEAALPVILSLEPLLRLEIRLTAALRPIGRLGVAKLAIDAERRAFAPILLSLLETRR